MSTQNGWVSGKVKFYDVGKGYGYVTPDNELLRDIFFHVTILKAAGFLSIKQGDSILVLPVHTQYGPKAVEAKPCLATVHKVVMPAPSSSKPGTQSPRYGEDGSVKGAELNGPRGK